MRLFLAIAFPPALREALAADTAAVRDGFAKARFVDPALYHLTLAFLGEVPTPRAADAVAAMNACRAAPFPLSIGRLGRFRGREGDTVWRAVTAGDELFRLQRALTDVLRKRGFSHEARAYSPHLTLARAARLREGVTFSLLNERLPARETTAAGMTLFLSHRVEGRLTYTPLQETHFSERRNFPHAKQSSRI